MKTVIIANGTMSIVLTPENEMEKFAIKELSGGEAKLIASGNTIMQNSVEGGLIITKPKNESRSTNTEK